MSFSDYKNKWLAQTGGLLPSIYATVESLQKTEVPSRRLPSQLPERLSQEVERKAETEIPPVQAMEPIKKEKEIVTTKTPATPFASEGSTTTRPVLSDHRNSEADNTQCISESQVCDCS